MPAGSYTVPVIDVVPMAQVICLHCRLMQVEPVPHKFGPPPPQNAGDVQLLQLAVSPPQPSDCWPQVPAGKSVQVSGVQLGAPPQTFGVPPQPQQLPPEQVPQLAVRPPQPSLATPQLAPSCAQVLGTHAGGAPPHSLGLPPQPQHAGAEQLPQLAVSPPQPSLTGPQFAPQSAQVFLTQATLPAPQTFGPPPPQISPALVQLPQLTRAPQPSATGPQS